MRPSGRSARERSQRAMTPSADQPVISSGQTERHHWTAVRLGHHARADSRREQTGPPLADQCRVDLRKIDRIAETLLGGSAPEPSPPHLHRHQNDSSAWRHRVQQCEQVEAICARKCIDAGACISTDIFQISCCVRWSSRGGGPPYSSVPRADWTAICRPSLGELRGVRAARPDGALRS